MIGIDTLDPSFVPALAESAWRYKPGNGWAVFDDEELEQSFMRAFSQPAWLMRHQKAVREHG